MTKRKKVTRAYKVGHTDGRNGEHKNPYPTGSQWAFDYERGFFTGTESIGVVFTFVPDEVEA